MHTQDKAFFFGPTNQLPGCSIVVNISQSDKLGWRQKLVVLEQTSKTSGRSSAFPTIQEREGGKVAGKMPVKTLYCISQR